MLSMKVCWIVIIEVHADDDPEKRGDDRHEVMLATLAVVSLTYHAFSCERLQLLAAERHGGCRHLTTTRSAAAVTPCKLEMQQALQRRASQRPLVGCYAELDSPDYHLL